MPAIATIALANGETTPVTHNFAPLGQDAKTGIWWFEDQTPRVATTSVLGFPRIGISTKRVTNSEPGMSSKSIVTRVNVTIALPAMETLGTGASGFTPSQTVAYVDRFKGEFILSARDVVADRKDVVAYAKNIFSNALMLDLVQNLTTLY
jgi:hypothetical protein